MNKKFVLALTLAITTCVANSQTLRIGLAEDPDILDPTLGRTFVGRIVFASLCDKLFDIDEKLGIVPQLATGYQWSADSKTLTIKLRTDVTFHDGEKMDAAAVKFNLERHKTMPGSNRSGELRPVNTVDVVDAATVRLNLSAPFTPLLAALAAWRANHAALDCTLVRGNHDSRAGDPPSALGICVVNEPWLIGPFAACHHPQLHPTHAVIAGHLHPACRLHGPGRDSLRLPCFVVQAGQAVFPAFGEFTGGWTVAGEAGRGLYPVGGGKVWCLPQIG